MRSSLHKQRTGLSLLELLLALGLTSFILVIIGMAMDFQIRALDSRRTQVEESQLARAVLRKIADDLRGAILQQEVDFSSVSGLSEAAAGAIGGDALADAGLSPDDLAGLTGDETPTEETEPVDIAATAQPAARPGLYGNQYQIQFDVSRLPRIDEYAPSLSDDPNMLSVPSDMKTVSYYLLQDSSSTTTGGASTNMNMSSGMGVSSRLDPTGQPTGLIRRELDRSVTLFAMNNGVELETSGEMLAPEVTRLEFQYFDGLQWLTEWDSQQMGGLPMAVEVAVAVASADPRLADQPRATSSAPLSDPTTMQYQDGSEYIYRLVVRLPVAELIEEEEEELAEDATMEVAP